MTIIYDQNGSGKSGYENDKGRGYCHHSKFLIIYIRIRQIIGS